MVDCAAVSVRPRLSSIIASMIAPDRRVRLATWILLVVSALMALCFGYVVWNAAVQRLGATHTAIYSNLVPLAALIVATLWLGEPLTPTKFAATGLIIGGVVLTRLQPRTPVVG